jgi:hypothetical protein
MDKDRKALLSTLWVFVVLNYLYCDVVGLMDSSLLAQYLSGEVGGMRITEGFLLGGSVLMEISIAMVLLSWVLKYGANRIANVLAGAITTAIQCASLFVGSGPTAYYAFFSAIEIACTLFIAVYAWRWRGSESPPDVVSLMEIVESVGRTEALAQSLELQHCASPGTKRPAPESRRKKDDTENAERGDPDEESYAQSRYQTRDEDKNQE